MKKWIILPTISVNDTPFLSSREEVRSRIDLPFMEVKKSPLSVNTMDVYDGFHVFYDEQNRFNAVEVFGDYKLVIKGKTIFPGTITKAKKLFPDIEYDGYGYTSISQSVGITVDPDDEDRIDGILFGCADYYAE